MGVVAGSFVVFGVEYDEGGFGDVADAPGVETDVASGL